MEPLNRESRTGRKRGASAAAAIICTLMGLLAAGSGCATHPRQAGPPPLQPAAFVNLPRFMGDWWVIAHIPWFAERDTYASKDTYRLRTDGRIETVFSFRKGSFEAREQTLRGVSWVTDTRSNAEWRVRFLWPFTLPYVVLYVDRDYRVTVVGHPSRNFAWIMARERTLSPEDYAKAEAALLAQGFDPTRLRKVPQVAPVIPAM